MREKALNVLLVAAMTAGVLTGHGGKSEDKGASADGEEGKVINIYNWNGEFHQRVEAVYPEVGRTSNDGAVTTLKDEAEIYWITDPNQDGVYQQKLDEALMKQADAVEDEKVDIFLSGTDYVSKYTGVEADAAISLKDLGIDPDKDPINQYDFTKVTASDAESVQRDSTWQCYPGLLVYRRDTAKEVFGTDDPTIIGERTNSWDALKTTAGELVAKGCFTFASYTDTSRLYGSSIVQPQVANSETAIKVDEQIVNWIKGSKEWLNAQYFDKTVKGQWNDDWSKTMGSEPKVFAFLLPTWRTDFVLDPNWDEEAGAWAVTTPPQEYNWGGSYVHAVTDTDNIEHVKNIILTVTADKDDLLKISKDYADFTSTKNEIWEAAKDDSSASEFFGGQNPFVYCAPMAGKVKITPLSAYDQGCVELIQNSFSGYFQGKIDHDKAKANFETAIKRRCPNITEIEWYG